MFLSKVREETLQWSDWRKRIVVQKLWDLAKAIDEIHQTAKGEKMLGKFFSLSGGSLATLAAAGVAFSFFSLGSSLVLSLPATFVGIAGGLVYTFSGMGETKAVNERLKECENVLNEDNKKISEILKSLDEVRKRLRIDEKKFWETVLEYLPYGQIVWTGGVRPEIVKLSLYVAAKGALNVPTKPIGEVSTLLKGMKDIGLKAVRVGSIGVGVFFAIWDAYSLVRLIQESDQSSLAEKIRNVARNIEPPEEGKIKESFHNLEEKIKKL